MTSARRQNVSKLQAIWNNSNNSHRLETGGRHRRRHGNVKGRCACEIIYGCPERHKKSYLKGYLAVIKRSMFNRGQRNSVLILTASGIKFFQKQTAGNNCPVCVTDHLNVRLRVTEIRFAQSKEGKPLTFIES